MNVPDPKPAIQAELQRIEEDCIHSGKAHFNAGKRWARYHYWLGIPSVVLSALAGPPSSRTMATSPESCQRSSPSSHR